MIHCEERKVVGFNPSLSRSSSSPKYFNNFPNYPYRNDEISLIDSLGLGLDDSYAREDDLSLDEGILPNSNNPFVLYYSNNSPAHDFSTEEPDFRFSRKGDCGGDLSPTPPSLPRPSNSITTDKRRINRFCGFLAVFLSLFLLLSSLLESTIDFRFISSENGKSSSEHILNPQPLISPQQEQLAEPKIKRLPQCVIIGARKCGTRALIDMLNLHPQVNINILNF